MHLNAPLAKAYARELNKLSKQLKLAGGPRHAGSSSRRAPGVFQNRRTDRRRRGFFGPAVEKALKTALSAMLKMARRREGRAFAGGLIKRITIMRKAVAQIKNMRPRRGGALSEAVGGTHQKRWAGRAGRRRRSDDQRSGIFRGSVRYFGRVDPGCRATFSNSTTV